MSGSAAKTSRRELRRAFGEQGLHVIEQRFNDNDARLDAIETAFRSGVASASSVRTLQEDLQRVRQVFKRGFVGRLKWLLLGR